MREVRKLAAKPQVAMAGSLAEAGDYLRSASLAQRAVTAAGTLSGGNLHARALMAWARAVALSARTGRAAATAQRAEREERPDGEPQGHRIADDVARRP